MAAVYAIGDLHGQAGELDRLLALVEADGGPEADLVLLGDLVDRGPDARGVIDRLVEGRAAGRNWTVLLGNHDRMFLRFLTGGIIHDPAISSGASWLHPGLGGRATLASYGVTVPEAVPSGAALQDLRAAARAAVPAAHLDFLGALDTMRLDAEHLFVHAGIRPGLPPAVQAEDDLLWIREPFLSDRRDHGRLVVHGHTALDAARHHGNRLNLDSGAGYGAPATVAAIEGRRAWVLTARGRVAL
ncbi:metallophosphoesterase family protein [Jannaschia ovalis]|uniref:Metallophosphoesterase family protein n=1 Tax=Jannaschia ovalis TaxID=3038773 RepID=A0ABY8L819_9RHOB|nr:metallophosphoesterase family protein [Jannaschia sp. GRR-S6-38]WGH77515.1 metallophosphoesterase family protein [Jannaschia sp. GRR-S6-38]